MRRRFWFSQPEVITSTSWVEARDTSKHPTMCGTALPRQQTIIQLEMQSCWGWGTLGYSHSWNGQWSQMQMTPFPAPFHTDTNWGVQHCRHNYLSRTLIIPALKVSDQKKKNPHKYTYFILFLPPKVPDGGGEQMSWHRLLLSSLLWDRGTTAFRAKQAHVQGGSCT